jgi:hypothetical protein
MRSPITNAYIAENASDRRRRRRADEVERLAKDTYGKVPAQAAPPRRRAQGRRTAPIVW